MTERRPPQYPPPLREGSRPQALGPQGTSHGARPGTQPVGSRSAQRQPQPEHPRPQTPQQPRSQQKFPPRPLPAGAFTRHSEDGWRSKDRDGGWGLLAYAGVGLAIVALIGGAGLGYLAMQPPVDLIQREIVSRVKARTGRDLTIGGPARFTIFPSLGVSMANVKLSGPPGMNGRPLVETASLDIRLRLLPLLGRRVEVEELVLREPVIELRTDKAGRRSWDIGSALSTPGRIELAQASTQNRATDVLPTVAAKDTVADGIGHIALESVRIQNGTVIWHDERSGVREPVTAVNLAAETRQVTGPLEVSGSLDLRGERFDVTGKLTSVKALVEMRPVKLVINATSRVAAVAFDGGLTVSGGADANGALEMRAPKVRALARFAGIELPAGSGDSAGMLKGRLTTSRTGVALEDATLELDGATASGTIGIDGGGARPLLRANLKVSELDLNKYLPQQSAVPEAAPQPTPSAPGNVAPSSIDDLLNRPGPRVKGFAQRSGWSEEPLRTAALGALDADVKLQVGRLRYRDVRLGPSRVAASLKDRVLTTTFDDVQLYEGRGRGIVTLDTSGPMPRLTATIAADGISALPLLKDAARVTWLAGLGRGNLMVTAQGGNQRTLMESLAGKADITFNNGAIVGWNIAQIIRGLKQGQLSGLDRTETAKTDFSELSSTWTIADGVAQNQDLRMTSPLLRVTGAGSVSLGARETDYLLRPKVVASLDGQGGAQGLAGLEVPLRIQGPWERPEITPEIGDYLKNPDKAVGAIKEIGKQFKGKKPSEIVDQVLGDNPETARKVNEILGKFLKPGKEAPAQ